MMDRKQVTDAVSPVLGYDMPELIEKVVDAVMAAQNPPPPTFELGDHVVFYEGMGENSLGIVRKNLANGMVYVMLDGYTDDKGVDHKPYGLPINPRSLHIIPAGDLDAARALDAARMLQGFTPIRAEVDDDPSV